MDDQEGMVVSVATSSEDSGYDNGFLSDSSSSTGSLEGWRPRCQFSPPCSKKSHRSKECHHKCAVSRYNIAGHSIEIISPRTFQYLSNCVRVLDLSKNKISRLPESLCQLTNLQELNLSWNNMQEVPESWKVFRSLRLLNLSHNNLSEVPKCLESGMERLNTIDLSHNKISDFVSSPLCLPVLQCLNLKNNCFDSFPLWLFSEQCRSLVELDVSLNFCFDGKSLLKKIPLFKHYRTSILKSLQKLYISNMGVKFEMVSDCLSNFESLQCIHMGNVIGSESTFNYFWKISTSIFSNPLSVTELYIPKVGLAGLPDDFCRLENLKVLSLPNNPLDWLPDSFGKLKSLEELDVASCNLSYLPDNFNQLIELKKLGLSHNKLTDVRGQLAGLTNLEYLDLYDNCLDEFPLAHNHVCTLRMLDVSANYVDLELALDFKVGCESLLDIYEVQQDKLRATSQSYAGRQHTHKAYSSPRSWSSCDSLHYKISRETFDSSTDLESESACESTRDDACFVEDEENWDDDSSSGDDYFDPNLVHRYFLPPGVYKFGWTPPIRNRECHVPIALLLSGFIYVPGQMHAKNTRKRRANIKALPTVPGQFDDVDHSLVSPGQNGLMAVLKRLSMFVRSPLGPNTRRCAFCGVYEDCWHHGFWIRF